MITLYGIFPAASSEKPDFKPVMQVQGQIILTLNLQAGDSVGYGSQWQSTKKTRIAVVALGYADGVPWRLVKPVHMIVKGRLYPIIGRISMDMLTLDLGDQDNGLTVGDWAVVWGHALPIERLAQQADTIPYELLTRVGQRVERQLVESLEVL